MTVEELSKLNRILIIRLSSLGDILLTTPFLRAIKTQFPHIKIDMLIREEYVDVIKLNPYIDKKFLFKKDDKNNNVLIEQLKNNNYELVIDLQNNLRSKKVVSSLKTNNVKLDKRSFDKFLLVNFKVNKLKEASQIPVRYSNTIQKIKLDEKGLDLFTDKSANAELSGKNNLIGFCPGARHFTKRWPKEYFIELGNKLTQDGYMIVLFGGKIDKEICAELVDKIPDAINLSNNDELLQTAADMKLCKAVICNDSGLMHTASATGTKVIAIFGSTVKEFGFAPYNCSNLILENNSLTCRPCSHIGRSDCPKKHFDCMKSIKPEFVFEKLISFLTLL
ncbi:MAG: glycosyltransferase family 9 protein [Ignavibacteriales bacterium]|nr:glycosyltransferase family 9 protein [Ignavibacteriales bacterium]